MFPRFYFIGDDDLLEILGQATNPVVIQSHLKKLFAGIHSVEFDEEHGRILAMKSLEGEVVQLKKAVHISNDVEVGGEGERRRGREGGKEEREGEGNREGGGKGCGEREDGKEKVCE